ncbi:MAG: ABC transporter ATP-binding protein [Myxococcota bacterium]
MLTVSQLSVDYGSHRVIEAFDLSIDASEIVTLVGPTGCGKSTLLRAIAGLVSIAEGQVQLGDWTATARSSVPPERRKVGMVFQDFALFPHLTVFQNVSFRLDDVADAEPWIELLDLGSLRDAQPLTLSGGQKQRVALARTLAHRPALVLLDEPLSNLDATLKDTLRWDIRAALKRAEVPALWVTHDQEEALSIGDRLGVLRDGQLEQLDTPEVCFRAPANRFVAGFLGEATFLSGKRVDAEAETALGRLPCRFVDGASGAVDVLVRPGDLIATAADEGADGRIVAARYEGESCLYAIALGDETRVSVRSTQEPRLEVGQGVRLRVVEDRSFAAFGPDPAMKR